MKNLAIFGAGLVLGTPVTFAVAVYVPPVRNAVGKLIGKGVARAVRYSPQWRREFRDQLRRTADIIDIIDAKEAKK